jgi:hypothetical protein
MVLVVPGIFVGALLGEVLGWEYMTDVTSCLSGRPSDVIYPVRLNADGTRRRSSVWSSSPDGKRTGIMDRLFRRSTSNAASERDQDENALARG